ncbi:EAL domain-containing protein [Pseudoduganella sp. SL102]|uniref:putative bifunctional diguanylate cyclase/phosphodiesterase n=1 Tax=Pseudoduganella sp. SL102 TaxID=2995154 RepID=UPI00248C672F|nr:EAL domain-containing protein [Pseudoduganella sp. SL102]WBS00085.1 EAL domain-containing protein [Pseudoduganella sp. SL102]
MKILVVTTDARDRLRLDGFQHGRSDSDVHFAFRYVDSVAGATGNGLKPWPDLILLNPLQLDYSPDQAFDELALAFDAIPIAVLTQDSAALGRHPAAGGTHRPHIVLDTANWQLLQEVFCCLVAAAVQRRDALQRRSHEGSILDAIADAVINTDVEGKVRYLNKAAMRLMALTPEAAADVPITALMELHDGTTLAPLAHPVSQALETGQTVRLPRGTIMLRTDGTEIIIEDATAPVISETGVVNGAVMVFHDVTDAHELQAQVDYLAWHDFLTGLPNRFAAQRHLNRILLEAQARDLPLAVMFLDLDKFKSVNDTLGHAVGDAVLVSVAARLRSCFRMIDLVSRQGGDEFVVLMAPGAGAVDATHAAERILAAVAMPHDIDGSELHVGTSIGIALYPEHGVTGEALLHHADTALHGAKKAGRNGWRFFSQDLLTSALQRKQMEDGVRNGLGAAEVELFYQPKIRMADGVLCGCEALLRWKHPEWGWVSPARFIRSAEETGMIVPLGRWVMAEAIKQAKQWQADGRLAGAIAINVSALELRQPGFVDGIEAHLADALLAPSCLQIELTESTLMRDINDTAGVLHRLKKLGLSLAIDDFGTGYSSLSYLAELPIDLLKVDRSFVHGIDRALPRKQALLRAVLVLADSMALPTVAEGIETGAEERFLADSGCTQGQGYYYSQAMDAAAFERAYLMLAPGVA